LAGVIEATDGVAEIFGRPAREARSHTGYLTQAFSLYPDLSVGENVRYAGDLRRVPPNDIAARGRRYLHMFDLERFRDRLAGRLSGGMKQKLALTCALVAEPRVLLLDEPTTGVDPVSRREFWDALTHLAAEGLTILVATPYLDEAERCGRVALIHAGELRQIGTPSELRRGLGPSGSRFRRSDCETPNTCCRASPAPRRTSSTCSGSATIWTSSPVDRTKREAPSRERCARPGFLSATSAWMSRASRTCSSRACGPSARSRRRRRFPDARTTHIFGDRSPSAPKA